jgi:hypothetical protein
MNVILIPDAILCNCEYTEDSKLIGNLCSHCKVKDDKLRQSVWYEEIKTIACFLNEFEYYESINDRLSIMAKIFEYILTRHDFMAKNPGFRIQVIRKIDECRRDERAFSLIHIFDKTSIFLEELKNYPDYKI